VPDGCFIPLALSTTALDFKHSVETNWTERKVTALRQMCFLQPLLPDRELSLTGQVNLDEINPRSRFQPRRHWHPLPVWLQPFYCSAASSITAAEHTGRLSLQCNAVVSRIITNAQGTRATGVAYVDRESMQTHEAHAKVVILCASTIEST